ncbi:rab-GTPase-TBC domain-containing protein [Spinellus fusiger]|nr:rab-GTPase-TBC domain-containing protein [Spinellus fusiger]
MTPTLLDPTAMPSHPKEQGSAEEEHFMASCFTDTCHSALESVHCLRMVSPCPDASPLSPCNSSNSSRHSSSVFSSISSDIDSTPEQCLGPSSSADSQDEVGGCHSVPVDSSRTETHLALQQVPLWEKATDSPPQSTVSKLDRSSTHGIVKTVSTLHLMRHYSTPCMEETMASDTLFGRLELKNESLLPQESISFILAQIERQNALLETDPKSVCIQFNKLRAHFSTVQRLVKDNLGLASSDPLEFSKESTHSISSTLADESRGQVEEASSVTEEIDWDFWEAIIQDFDRVALRLPHLLAVKLRAGIPRRVRGLIWQSMCKSASLHLETVYDQLCRDRSPHERIIQRDLARTFPHIDMFKQENGPGQVSMRRILEAYSLYDANVGYCQGLAFLVGPLLMNMSEIQAFCVFVRLMETYEMRSMFTLNMEGLQLRLYQFSRLLSELLPHVANHLEKHSVHAAMYASQWFLTLFAYAFPIDLVARIYDIIFAEGAAETIMRVAIAILKRSEKQILQEDEFEHLLDFITSRKLCEPYGDNYGDVIQDAMKLSDVITRNKLDALNEQYKNEGEKEKRCAEQVLTNKSGFWKKKGTKNSSQKQKQKLHQKQHQKIQKKEHDSKNSGSLEMIRSLSSSDSIKKRRTDYEQEPSKSTPSSSTLPIVSSTNNGDSINLQKIRSSFSSSGSLSLTSTVTGTVVPVNLSISTSTSNSSISFTTSESSSVIAFRGTDKKTMAKLRHAFDQLSKDHQHLTEALVELKMDKHDLEAERNALKMTMIEMERRYNSSLSSTPPNLFTVSTQGIYNDNTLHTKPHASSEQSTTVNCIEPGFLPIHQVAPEKKCIVSAYKGAAEGSVDSSKKSSHVSISCCYENNECESNINRTNSKKSETEENEAVGAEIVRVKVENFELHQQVERLVQEAEDMQSRLDMVNEGQMALVDRLMTVQYDMEVMIEEKDNAKIEWKKSIKENTILKKRVSHLLLDNTTLVRDVNRLSYMIKTKSPKVQDKLTQKDIHVSSKINSRDRRLSAGTISDKARTSY